MKDNALCCHEDAKELKRQILEKVFTLSIEELRIVSAKVRALLQEETEGVSNVN